MSVYNVQGIESNNVYDVDGLILSSAYDIDGNNVLDDSPTPSVDPMDWSGMPSQFRSMIDDCVEYIQTYLGTHNDAFALPIITDVHTYFDGNEPNYLAYNHPSMFPLYLFLGDMVNIYDETQLNNAVTYMQGAIEQTSLVSIGNHEWGNYDTSGTDDYPREWYKPLLPSSCVFFEDDGLTYYYDDVVNNVRYIMLDSNSTVKKQSGVQRFDMDALDWLAGVLEVSGNKDIIVMNHAMGSGFYLVTDSEQANWQSDTTVTNIGTFHNIVNAYINRTTISVSVDGVAYSHDFANVTGNFIAYITGHYHNAGYTNTYGFNKFTCPAIIRNKTKNGTSFFIIDKELRKITFLVIRYENTNYELYEYTY